MDFCPTLTFEYVAEDIPMFIALNVTIANSDIVYPVELGRNLQLPDKKATYE